MYFVLLLLAGVAAVPEWVPESYPNPRRGQFKECKMRSVSNVCDPDEVLTESERYRLNSELTRLGARTETNSGTFCSKKGIDGILVIVPEGSQMFASQLSQKWQMDSQCHKSALFLLAPGERKLYFVGGAESGIDSAQFDAIASAENSQLSRGQYTAAIVNILKELGKNSNPLEPESRTPPTRAAAALLSLPFLIIALLL